MNGLQVRDGAASIRRQRRSSVAVRETILAAAEAEFSAAGFGGARAERIAIRARVNKALPFYHFGSKADLYEEVLRRAWRRLGEALVAHADSQAEPRERFALLLDNLFNFVANNRSGLRLLIRELIDDPAGARKRARRCFEPIARTLREIIAARVRKDLVAEVDPLQVLISALSEPLFYFLLAPLLEGIGLKDPLSPESLATSSAAVRGILRRGFGVSNSGELC